MKTLLVKADSSMMGMLLVKMGKTMVSPASKERGNDGCDEPGVEQFDGEGSTLSAEFAALDWNLEPESLKVDNERKHSYGSDQVHNVRQPLPVERFLQSATFVVPGEEEVKQGDESSFELGSSTRVDRGGGEGLPDDGFTDVGRDEEVDTTS